MNTGRKPRVGSRRREESLADNPAYAKEVIASLARRAEGGDKEAVANLMGWLERHPDLRPLVRGLDDLATRVERAWVDRLCGADELARSAVGDELVAMRAELLGPAPSVTDKVLAATVLVGYLGFERAALAASLPTDMPAVREARERLLLKAQQRLQDAVRGWELYAGKKARGLHPGAKLKLFEPDVAV